MIRLSRLPLALLFSMALAFLACGGDDPDQPGLSPTTGGAIATSTRTPETTPATSVTPRTTPGATVATPTREPEGEAAARYNGHHILGEFRYGEAVDFPHNVLMVVETGCTQCDSPTEALYRVWRNDGETHVDRLIDRTVSDYEHAHIHNYALKPDLSDIVVSVCTAGSCSGLGPDDPTAETTLYRSLDGGMTWTELAKGRPGELLNVVAVTDEGIALAVLGRIFYLEGADVPRPAGADGPMHDSHNAGELRWQSAAGDVVVNQAGKTLAAVEPGGRIEWLKIGPDRRLTSQVTLWSPPHASGGQSGWHVTQMQSDFQLIGYHTPQWVGPAVVLNSGIFASFRLPGSEAGGPIGYIDVLRGEIAPIGGVLLRAPFGDGAIARGRNHLEAALEGPFLRVTSTSGCVEVRVDTTVQAQALTCAADGVIVYDLENSVTLGAQQWRHVRLVDGREGYVPAEYFLAD